MELIDSHCHLNRASERGELGALLATADASGVRELIAVGTSLRDWGLYHRLAGEHLGRIHFTVGIHPTSVEEDWEDQVKALPTYFGTEPMPVALGEIGLDHFHLSKFPDEAAEEKALQLRAFRAQLGLAYELDCPVVIHSRQAFAECVAEIDASRVDWRKVVFHCFSEGPEAIAILNEKGGRGSFTGILTYKSKSVDPVRAACRQQGWDRLMLETDSPYLAPEPKRGTVNEPANTRFIAEYVAQMAGMSLEDMAKRTTANTRAFFRL